MEDLTYLVALVPAFVKQNN